ncbi:unnamed protein product [Ilex paraguariensis]|uniref:Exostosin GT47 domain-containing protein n=1 Tax=Ilex paraguariensis TaxID=185542 RepID=A0ABC8T216_9AQUA
MFNYELVQNCDDLNPWTSRCEALSNHGYGRRATGLSEIIPENLTNAWYWTDQFALELIFHNRMKNYRCRTLEPESATAFYIPFYAGLAVGKYLWSDNSTGKDRDRHCEMMLKSRLGFALYLLAGMRNITRLLIERNSWDYFDIGVPYPTGFHPSSSSDVKQWQHFVRTRHRKTLYCFAGATRGFIKNDFRGLLLSQCFSESDSCRVVDCGGSKCSNGTSAILETFLDSDFCLQPRGDSFTRRSIFDCMVAGSIPVFFWNRTAYYQYEWFLPGEPGSYSVYIDRNDVKNGKSIKGVLKKISREEVRKMREKVIDYLPNIVYGKTSEGLEGIRDAFDVAVEGVLSRVKEQEETGYKWRNWKNVELAGLPIIILMLRMKKSEVFFLERTEKQ